MFDRGQIWRGGAWLAAGVAALAGATTVDAQGAVRASAPVVVSGPVPTLARCGLNGDDNTPQLAVDRGHPKRIALSYFTGDDRAGIAATSRDGGATWRRSVMSGLTTCTGGDAGQLVDPELGFAAGGTLIASPGWVKSQPRPGDRDHAVVRQYTLSSADGGRNWSRPVDVDPATPHQRGFLARGPRGDELMESEQAYYDWPTYAYPQPSGVDILSSADDGRAWRRTATIPGRPGHTLLAAGLLRSGATVTAILADVDLLSAGPALASGALGAGDGLPGTLLAAVSTDGGRTFAPPTVIASCFGGSTCVLPASAVASDGSLLLAYSTGIEGGPYALRLARSTDGGLTWSTHEVASLSKVPDMEAVAARRGAVGILAIESPGNDAALDYAVLHVSGDDARTWSSVRLAGPFDEHTITYPHFDGQLGPQMDLAVIPKGFAAAYPVLAPYPLTDGEQDVVFQRILVRR